MRIQLVFLFVLTLCLSPWNAFAVPVHSLYQSSIPVAAQTTQDKNTALSKALAEVLIKVSGNAHVLSDSPTLKSRLDQPANWVQQTRYEPNPGDKQNPYKLNVQFDPEAINTLLEEANIPVWGQNRPLILTWIAVSTPGHPADIIDTSNNIEENFKTTARKRGLPVIFPIMDAVELTVISANDIETNSLPTIQQASLRYATDAILTGNIKQNANDYSSQWQLIMGNDRWNWDVTGKTLQEVLNGIVDNIANTMAPRYATSVATSIQSEITLHVRGVDQQTELLRLMKYLKQLTPVADVQLQNVNGDEIVLGVSLSGTQQAFVKALSVGKTLQPLPGTSDQDDVLQYKWNQ